jgi:hypothetical protein
MDDASMHVGIRVVGLGRSSSSDNIIKNTPVRKVQGKCRPHRYSSLPVCRD